MGRVPTAGAEFDVVGAPAVVALLPSKDQRLAKPVGVWEYGFANAR